VRKSAVLIAILGTLWGCVTMAPPPPSLHIESPTASFTESLPLDARIAVEDAWNELQRGRADRAQKIILRLGEKSPFYFAGLGYVTFLRNDLASSQAYFLKAVEDYPGLVVAHLGLGQLYLKSGQDEAAFNAFLEVLKREPDNAFALRESEVLRSRLVESHLALAEASAAAGDREKAKEAYLRILDLSPKLGEAHLALARLYLLEKDTQSALFHLRTASANDPKDAAILQEYARALEQANQLGRSLDAYERFLALDPQNNAVRERLEALKAKLGVVELPSQYGGIPELEAVAKEDLAALIAVKFREIVDDDPPKPPVIVDIATSWASRFIVKVAALEIMEVYANHTFQPRKQMTRGEMAAALVRLIGILQKKGIKVVAQIPPERIRISDVPPEHLRYGPIVQIVSYQVMGLGPDRTFRPEQTITGSETIRNLDLLLGLVQ
jgi:tetratricopeptide (TPR) repeat protein